MAGKRKIPDAPPRQNPDHNPLTSVNPTSVIRAIAVLSQDLLTRPGVTIQDLTPTSGVTDVLNVMSHGLITTDDPAEITRHEKERNVNAPSRTWALLCVLAKLIILRHLRELTYVDNVNGDQIIDEIRSVEGDDHPAMKPNDTETPLLHSTITIHMPRVLQGHSPKIGLIPPCTPEKMNIPFVWYEYGQVEWDAPNMPIPAKIMIELLDLADHSKESILRYATTQHDFVLSGVACHFHDHISLRRSKDYASLDEIKADLAAEKNILNGVFMVLLYDCDLGLSAIHTSPDSSGVDIAKRHLIMSDGSDDHSIMASNDEHSRLIVTPEIDKAAVDTKTVAISAVYGACRFTPGTTKEMEDAHRKMSHFITVSRPLNLVAEQDPINPIVRDGDTRTLKHVKRYIGAGVDDVYYANLPYEPSKLCEWDSCCTPGHGVRRSGFLADSVINLIPDDLKSKVTLSWLNELESNRRFMKDFLFFMDWDCRSGLVKDLLVATLAKDEDLLKEVGEVLDKHWEDRFLPDPSNPALSGPTMEWTARRATGGKLTVDDLGADDLKEAVRQSVMMCHSARFVRDHHRMGVDTLGGSRLLEILVMVSAVCVFMNCRFRVKLDVSWDADRALMVTQECFDMTCSCIDGRLRLDPEAGGYVEADGVDGPGRSFVRLAELYDRLADALVEATFWRLVMRLGTDDEGLVDDAYPEDFLKESVEMKLQDEGEAMISEILDGGQDS